MTGPSSTAVTWLDGAVLRATRGTLGGTPAVPVARALSRFGDHAMGRLVVGAVGWLGGRRRVTERTGGEA